MNKYISSLISLAIYSFMLSSSSYITFLTSDILLRLWIPIIIYAIGTFLLLFFQKKIVPIPRIIETSQKNYLTVVMWGVIGGIMVLVTQVFLIQTGNYFFKMSNYSENTTFLFNQIAKFPLLSFVVILCAPIAEELVFRRGLTAFFSQKFNFTTSILLSSAIFSLVHQDGPFLIYFIMGTAFSYLYQHTSSIVAPIIAHVIMNIVVSLVYLHLL